MDKVQRFPRTGEEEGKKVFAKDMRITMAIPHKRILGHIPDISIHTLTNFQQMAETTAKAGYEVFVNTGAFSSNTPVTREQIASSFIGDWLLMIDPDALPMPDTGNRLLMAAKADPDNLKKIVCAPAVRTSYPHLAAFGEVNETGFVIPWIYGNQITDEDIDTEEIRTREVGASGFHAVLIHRSVFEEVPWPWFPLNVLDPETGERYGHDYNFCRAAARCGIKVYLEFSCRVGHLGLQAFTLADNRAIIKANPIEAAKQAELVINPDGEPEDGIHDRVNYFLPRPESAVSADIVFPKGALGAE